MNCPGRHSTVLSHVSKTVTGASRNIKAKLYRAVLYSANEANTTHQVSSQTVYVPPTRTFSWENFWAVCNEDFRLYHLPFLIVRTQQKVFRDMLARITTLTSTSLFCLKLCYRTMKAKPTYDLLTLRFPLVITGSPPSQNISCVNIIPIST